MAMFSRAVVQAKLGGIERSVGGAKTISVPVRFWSEGEKDGCLRCRMVEAYVPPHVGPPPASHFVPQPRVTGCVPGTDRSMPRQHHNGRNGKERAVHALGRITFSHGQPGSVTGGQVDGRGAAIRRAHRWQNSFL